MLFPALLLAPTAYVAGELRWRAGTDRELRAADGWLAVAGLHWLKDGQTATLGTGGAYDVSLPGRVVGPIGTVTRAGDKVWFAKAAGARVFLGSDPSRILPEGLTEVHGDDEREPTRVNDGRAVFTVIRRGSRVGLRVYDPQSSRRTGFKGLRWYPVDPKLRVIARFVPYAKPKTLMITNVLGDVHPSRCLGYAEFRLGGRLCRLDAEDAGGMCFFNFNDRTNNRTTYGAGRFLEAGVPKGGKVVLDFNRATNPPCAFTDFATCPLPPKGNQLPVEVRAGALNGHTE